MSIPWTARRSNQSILREINPEYSLEELMLKVQYFGLLMGRVNSLGKNKQANKQTKKHLILGTTEGRSRRRDRAHDGWMASATQRNEFEQALGNGDGQTRLRN